MPRTDSIASSSVYSFKLFEGKREAELCDQNTFNRVKALALAIESQERDLEKDKARIEDGGDLAGHMEAREMSVAVGSLKIENSLLLDKVERLQRLCTKKRLLIAQLLDDQKKKDNEERLLLKKSIYSRMRYEKLLPELHTRQKHLNMFVQLIRHRRKVMLQEVFDIFRLKVDVLKPSTSRSDCNCGRLDFIGDIHLPSTNVMQSHLDSSLSPGLGDLVHLMECVSRILDYNYRYPLNMGASTSSIYYPKDDRTVALYGFSTRWRSDRERMDLALTLLSRNIAQLRSDSGFCSRELDRMLYCMQQWGEAVTRGGVSIDFAFRPWESALSPALLIDVYKDENSAGQRREALLELMENPKSIVVLYDDVTEETGEANGTISNTTCSSSNLDLATSMLHTIGSDDSVVIENGAEALVARIAPSINGSLIFED